jgi:hypothetical protein
MATDSKLSISHNDDNNNKRTFDDMMMEGDDHDDLRETAPAAETADLSELRDELKVIGTGITSGSLSSCLTYFCDKGGNIDSPWMP